MPTVTIYKDDRVLARTLADEVVQALAKKPDLVLGLPTGRTPIRLYHELGALHAKGLVVVADRHRRESLRVNRRTRCRRITRR